MRLAGDSGMRSVIRKRCNQITAPAAAAGPCSPEASVHLSSSTSPALISRPRYIFTFNTVLGDFKPFYFCMPSAITHIMFL